MIVALEEAKRRLIEIEDTVKDLRHAIRYDDLTRKVEELEASTMADDFWSNADKSSKVLQSIKQMKDKCAAYDKLCSSLEDALTLAEMAIEENDEGSVEEVERELRFVESETERQRLETLLTGEYDRNNAIVSFHPGAGGTEAQDWAQMLYRMYT
ncbi:MAG: PCRF domain-containing protein, partial [Clostridia bacterium]|nr:PCRF domain-containing protein [Clostridia bacterium]